MNFGKQEGQTHIFTEKDETDQQVLRAIVKSSFELARPAGMGWLHFDNDQKMTDEDADHFINMSPEYGNRVVGMDYVQGRQCKTFINKISNGHFTMNDHAFERDRGTSEPMLNRAKKIILGKIDQESKLADTSNMYSGESLTMRMREYGFERYPNEKDWDFRKRVFPDMFQESPDRAMEFLFGASAAEWNDVDKMLCLILLSKGKQSRHELERFTNGFNGDPIRMRGEKMASATF